MKPYGPSDSDSPVLAIVGAACVGGFLGLWSYIGPELAANQPLILDDLASPGLAVIAGIVIGVALGAVFGRQSLSRTVWIVASFLAMLGAAIVPFIADTDSPDPEGIRVWIGIVGAVIPAVILLLATLLKHRVRVGP